MPRKKKSVRKVKKTSRRSGGHSKSASRGTVHTVTQHAKESMSAFNPKIKRASRVRIVVKNLILFGFLFLLFSIVALISSNALVDNMFWFLAMLMAFVAVAFLILLLTILFMRGMRK